MDDTASTVKTPPPGPPKRKRPTPLMILALAFVIVLAGAFMLWRSRGCPLPRRFTSTSLTSPFGPQLPGPGSSGVPGQLSLRDFQIVIPQGWQRHKEWEDEGPGTELFLVGPVAGASNLVLGVDVYPLREDTTLDDFGKQYSAKWNPGLVSNQPATLCNQPARMLELTENGQDKLYLVAIWRGRGFAVGMIGPAGQQAQTTPLFRQVVDSFQLYQ